MKHGQGRKRRQAYLRGLDAEARAVLLLRLKFYRILARRYRTPAGEIDIIASRGGVINAIEVKARAREAEALEALSPRQQRRIVRALLFFQSRHPALAHLDCRFDIIWVAPYRIPKHIVDAWRL
jgi:putative endonuclease